MSYNVLFYESESVKNVDPKAGAFLWSKDSSGENCMFFCYDGLKWEPICKGSIAVVDNIESITDPENYIVVFDKSKSHLFTSDGDSFHKVVQPEDLADIFPLKAIDFNKRVVLDKDDQDNSKTIHLDLNVYNNLYYEDDTTKRTPDSVVLNNTNNIASGIKSISGGFKSESSGKLSVALGESTIASGELSVALGESTIASGNNQHVQGKYNVEDTESLYADIVGGGESTRNRKNIEVTTWDGDKKLAGDVYVNCNDDSTGGSKLASEEYVEEYVDAKIIFNKLNKIKKYLYEIEYDSIDYEFADEYFRSHSENLTSGGCTAVRNGSFYGRNFDFFYNADATFVVRTPKNGSRHCSIGVGNVLNKLTEEVVSSKTITKEIVDAYRILPFMVIDGINDCGVTCSMNLVPKQKGNNSGTNPSSHKDLCAYMIVRYILDNFDSAQNAVEGLSECNIWSPEFHGYDFHIMVADSNDTYFIEFIDKNNDGICEYYYYNFNAGENGDSDFHLTDCPWMTNFHLVDVDKPDSIFNSTNISTIESHGSGVERWNVVKENYATSNTLSGMTDLMSNKLRYSQTYERETNPYWYSELVGESVQFGDLTVEDAFSENASELFSNVMEYAIKQYEDNHNEGRIPRMESWETSHSSVYDIKKKELNIIIQEESIDTQLNFKLDSNIQVQSDWEEDDETSVSHIKNRAPIRKSIGFNSSKENDITNNIASGDYSHVEGASTSVHGSVSHGEGVKNIINEGCHASHIEGGENFMQNSEDSHVEGLLNVQNKSNYSHIEGQQNILNYADGTHSEGLLNKLISDGGTDGDSGFNQANHIEGQENTIDSKTLLKDDDFVNKQQTASYNYPLGSPITYSTNSERALKFNHIEGLKNNIIDGGFTYTVQGNHLEGYNNSLEGIYNHAEGHGNIITGPASYSIHIEGTHNTINSSKVSNSECAAHIEGLENYVAVGDGYSNGYLTAIHVEGMHNRIYGQHSQYLHVGGFQNNIYPSNADFSFVHGYNNNLYGGDSLTVAIFGMDNSVHSGTNDFSFVCGKSNTMDSSDYSNYSFMSGGYNGIHAYGSFNTIFGYSNNLYNSNNNPSDANMIGGEYNSITNGNCSFIYGYSNSLTESGNTPYDGGNVIFGHYNSVVCSDDSSYGGENFIHGYSHQVDHCDKVVILGGQYNEVKYSNSAIINSYSSKITKDSSEQISSDFSPRNTIIGSLWGTICHNESDKGHNGIYSAMNATIQYSGGRNIIIGGNNNAIRDGIANATLLGGCNNTIENGGSGNYFQILNGNSNLIGNTSYGYQTILGGYGNSITNGSNDFCSILGGSYNFVGEGSHYNTVVSGCSNRISAGPGDFGLILSGYYNEIKSDSPYSVILGGCFNTATSGAQCNLLFGNFNKIENGGCKSILFGEDNYATVTGSYIEGMGNVNYGMYSHVEGIGELPVTLEGTATTKVYKIKFSNSAITFSINDLIHEGNYIVSGGSHGAGLNSGGVKILGITYVSSSSGAYYTVFLDQEIDTSLNWFVKGGNTTPFSHVEGANNINHGRVSHIEGQGNYNIGEYSHISGQNNINYAPVSFIGGCKNIIYGTNPSSSDTYGQGGSSAVFGNQNIVYGEGNFAVGILNRIYDSTSGTIGVSFVGGVNNTCNSRGGFVMGNSNYAEGSETINVLGRDNTVRKITYETSSGSTSTSNPDSAFVTGTSNRVFGSTHNTFVQGVKNRLNDFGNVETYELYQTTNSGYTNTSSTYWEITITGSCSSFPSSFIEEDKKYFVTIDGETFSGVGRMQSSWVKYIGDLNGTYISYDSWDGILKIRFDGSNHSMTTTKSVTMSLSGLIDKTVSVAYSQTFGNSHMICGPVHDLYTFGTYNKILCDGNSSSGVNKVYKGDVSYCAIFGDTNMLKSGTFHNDYLMGVGNTLENVSYATVFGNTNTIKNISKSSLIYGTANNINGVGYNDGLLYGGSVNQITNAYGLTGSIITGSSNRIENSDFLQSVIFGQSNTIQKGGVCQSLIFGNCNNVRDSSLNNNSYVTSSILSGYGNKLHSAYSSVVLGTGNEIGFVNNTFYSGQDFLYVNGGSNKVFNNVGCDIVNGHNNTVSASQITSVFGVSHNVHEQSNNMIVSGYQNTVHDTRQGYITGCNNNVNHHENSIVYGYYNTVDSNIETTSSLGYCNIVGGSYNGMYNNVWNAALFGNYNTLKASDSIVGGANNTIDSYNSIVSGDDNLVDGYNNIVVATHSEIDGYNTAIFGAFNKSKYSETGGSQSSNNILAGYGNESYETIDSSIFGNGNRMEYSQSCDITCFGNTILGGTQSSIEGACNTITGAHASHAEGEDNFITNHVSHAEGCKHNIFGAYSHSEGFGGQKLSVTVFDASTNKYRIEFDNSAVKTSANTVLTIGSMLVNGTSQTVGISDVIRITNIEYDNGYVYTTDTTLDLTNDVYMAEGVTNVASHSEGISNTVHAIGSHAEGISNFVISSNGSHVSGISNVIDSTGRSDAIIAGTYNSITGTAENTVVIGGHNIVGTESNTVYVPSLELVNGENHANLSVVNGDINVSFDNGETFIGLVNRELTNEEIDEIIS